MPANHFRLPPPPSTPAAFVPPAPPPDGRRRWTAGELTEIVTVLAALSTDDIASRLGVNPKALRSALRRHGISMRALRKYGREAAKEQIGLLIRRSKTGPSAVYGAEALTALSDSACRWPIGDPSKRNFTFCGAPRLAHASYCRHHQVKAFARQNSHGR